jgi:hypothetical protein
MNPYKIMDDKGELEKTPCERKLSPRPSLFLVHLRDDVQSAIPPSKYTKEAGIMRFQRAVRLNEQGTLLTDFTIQFLK